MDSQTSFRQCAKILSILRRRKSEKNLNYSQLSKQSWPTSCSLSLINNIQATQPILTTKAKPDRPCSQEKTFMPLATSIPLFITRPQTSQQPIRRRVRKTHNEKSLFQWVREEKLGRLREQKEQLMATIFGGVRPEGPRLEEEQQHNKPNSINFRAYNSLNRLMDIQQKMNYTASLRPKTSLIPSRSSRRA